MISYPWTVSKNVYLLIQSDTYLFKILNQPVEERCCLQLLLKVWKGKVDKPGEPISLTQIEGIDP